MNKKKFWEPSFGSSLLVYLFIQFFFFFLYLFFKVKLYSKWAKSSSTRRQLVGICLGIVTQKILLSSLNAFKFAGIPLPLFLQFIYD